MKLENQVCSLELAKQLKKLGVKQDSLFCWEDDSWKNDCDLKNNITSRIEYCDIVDLQNDDILSAFTVAELGELLQKNITINNINRCLWYSRSHNILELYHNECSKKHIITIVDDKSEADARAKMLIYLLENKLM